MTSTDMAERLQLLSLGSTRELLPFGQTAAYLCTSSASAGCKPFFHIRQSIPRQLHKRCGRHLLGPTANIAVTACKSMSLLHKLQQVYLQKGYLGCLRLTHEIHIRVLLHLGLHLGLGQRHV